jgi:hypothetical protein
VFETSGGLRCATTTGYFLRTLRVQASECAWRRKSAILVALY